LNRNDSYLLTGLSRSTKTTIVVELGKLEIKNYLLGKGEGG